MATLPRATTTIDDEAVAFGAGDDIIAVCAPVPGVAAVECAIFGSPKALLDEYGYSQGAAYAALHADETGLPVMFVAMPVATAGGVSHVDATGVTGTSAVTVAAAAGGVLEQVDATLTVTAGGTIGADQIECDLSLDGGFTTRSVRLGTANSYAPLYTGVVVSFGAGTLVAGDVLRFKTHGPKWAAADLAAVRSALKEKQAQPRSVLLIGDADSNAKIDAVRAAMEAHATGDDRFTLARVQLRDQYRPARIVGNPELTFAEVGATGDTITRDSGSFVADGFKPGMRLTIAGSASNDSTSHDIAAVTATVLTLGTSDLAAETIDAADLETFEAAESKAAWRSSIIADVASISGDNARRIDAAAGYAAKLCPISGWRLRRPASWLLSLREYQHDVHIPNWRRADGALAGATLENASKALVEHDERVDGGLLAAGISCLTTANNRAGVFSALSLTRADPGSLLSRTHNMYVANVACSTVQAATDAEIGNVLELQRGNGRATEASLVKLEGRINDQLDIALGNVRGEGVRASSAVWQASRDDVLNVPGAAITGILTLEVNGTIERMRTTVRVPAGG